MNTFEENGIILPNFKDLPESSSDKVSLEKFAKYMDKIFLNQDSKDTCILFSHFISDYYISVDYTTLQYIIPSHIRRKLVECKSTNTRFFILPIMFKFNEKDSHANVLIVDNKTNTIELYEPHGSKFLSYDIIFDNQTHVQELVSIILSRQSSYKFINVHDKCPIGLQTKQTSVNKTAGHCVAWTLFFIHVKMYNLHKTSEELIDFFDKFDVNKLNSYIKKYITLIENETKDIKKRDKEDYHHFQLTPKEQENAKKLIVYKVTKYLESIDKSKNIEKDIQNIFNEFIIFSRYDFFHSIFFRVANHFFKRKS